MGPDILRKFILLLSVVVPASQLYLYAANSYPLSSEIEQSRLQIFVNYISNFVLTLPVSLIGFWIAHNLKPLRWVSPENLCRILAVTAYLVIASTLAILIREISSLMPYLPNLPGPNLHTIMGQVYWVLYSVLEACILLFAAYQLSQKTKKSSLSSEMNGAIK